jgi:hypothetical protein
MTCRKLSESIKRISIAQKANQDIMNILETINKDEQLQTVIHPELNFKRNSINLLISRRGVGKTFTVMRELIKLSNLPDLGKYTQFIYITDKTNDATVNELIKLIKLKVHVIRYENAVEVVNDIIKAKNAYEQVLEKKLISSITDESRDDILSSLDLEKFTNYIPHTAILMDDAMNVLKETKYKTLRDLIFQNRQPKLTIFICLQDAFGIPASIKRNIDTVWLFAGLTDKTIFNIVVRQLGCPMKVDELWKEYKSLGFRDAVIFDYEDGEMRLKIIEN